MSTTEPKAGEWWWVEIADGGRRRPAEVVIEPRTGHLCWEMEGRLVNARPIARIPDPPAPEPTEAEKIDARRVHAIKWLLADVDALIVRDVVRTIRASDKAAGYVLVPTSGEGFEAMVRAAKRATVYRGDIYSPATVMVEDGIRAFLEAAKGEAR